MPPEPANPDQALLQRFLASNGEPIPCDSNPLAEALGAELLAADAQAGTVLLAFEPQALFIQGEGVLQGGAITAMLDFAMAYAAMVRLPVGVSCATVNLSTAFLKPAPAGRYLARGEVDRLGKAMAFTQARLYTERNDSLVATANSTLAVR